MKIRFEAKSRNIEYAIVGNTINGMDLSVIPADTKIEPLPKELGDAGINEVYTDNSGELYVTLQQRGLPYQVPVDSHDWRGKLDWIDSESYSKDECYISPISAPEGTKIRWTEYTETRPRSGTEIERKGWTVIWAGDNNE